MTYDFNNSLLRVFALSSICEATNAADTLSRGSNLMLASCESFKEERLGDDARCNAQ
jgi:hypothetical protein